MAGAGKVVMITMLVLLLVVGAVRAAQYEQVAQAKPYPSAGAGLTPYTPASRDLPSATPEDRWYLAFRSLVPRLVQGLQAHLALLEDLLAAQGKIKSPILLDRARRTRAMFADLARDLAALPSPTARTQALSRDLARAASLYATAYASYERAFRTGAFAGLDRGDVQIQQAQAILVTLSPRVGSLRLSVKRQQPPRAFALYARRLALLARETSEAEAAASGFFDAFLRGDQDESIRLARPALARYRMLVRKVTTARPQGADRELRLLASDVERAYVLIRDGLALMLRGLVQAKRPVIINGANKVTSGERLRVTVLQRLAIIAFRYV